MKMKFLIVLSAMIVCCGRGLCSDVEATDSIHYIYSNVLNQPEFPGGEKAMYKWIDENLVYPPEVMEEGITGRVIVQFTVTKEGEIKNAKVVRGRHPALDKEALRLVNSMPKWKPGKEPKDVVYNLPVVFKSK